MHTAQPNFVGLAESSVLQYNRPRQSAYRLLAEGPNPSRSLWTQKAVVPAMYEYSLCIFVN